MPELDLATIERQSVENLPQVDTKTGAVENSSLFWGWSDQRGAILSAFGTRRRMIELLWYDRHQYNTLWQGARSGLIKKIKATSYELKGGRNLTNRFDDVLRNAQLGAGWGVFLSLFLRDYLRYDNGAFAEITAPGNPLKAPTGAVTGIKHLDSLRCFPTGDPEYPVVYYNSRPGEKPHINVMHHTRILHLIDTPDGDQDRPGYGESSLSRAIAVVQRQLLINQYTVGKLDDKPSPGVMIANNMSKEDRDKAFAIFRGEQSADLLPEWGKVAWFFNLNPAIQASLTPVTFSTAPEKYDYPVYVNVDVNELALAIGVDKQELWELSGATGTAGQSIIQSEKSEGKAPGEIRASLEREINNKLLPDSLEFQWKVKDGRASQQEATTAQTWVGVATSAAGIIGNELAARLLANQVEALADVLFDENGQLVRLPSEDQKPADEQSEDITAQDAAPNTANTNGSPTTAQDSTPNATKAQKDIQATRLDFEADFTDLLSGARDGDVNRRRAGVVLRALISKYGRTATSDGLKDGGVADGQMDDEDRATYAVQLAEQSGYVTTMWDTVFQQGISDTEAASKAELWFNKSIMPFYQNGLASADKNGIYEWVLGNAEHCADCLKMSGQKHRLKAYTQKGILPQADILECRGFNCACSLKKTNDVAQGTWLN